MVLKKDGKDNNIEAIKAIQKVLEIKVDGDYGPKTEKAVKEYQRKHGLTVDGKVGLNTAKHMGINLYEYVDTDRTDRLDDPNDKDDKLTYHGSYTTEDNLKIDRAYLDSNEYVRDYGKVVYKNLFIHHTAGWNNPYNTINNWNKDKRGRVATQYCIGGTSIKKGKYGDDKYNGVVVECFPNNYIGWHLGKIGNKDMLTNSCGIEVNNFGYAEKKGNKFYNYVGVEIPKDMVCDLGYEFRGHRYWHAYTEEQIESLRLLIKHIQKIYPTIDMDNGLVRLLKDGVEPSKAFEFNSEAYYGKSNGLWSHSNVRKDKFDMSPQPILVDMLKSL